jgi:hypothetical protein
MAKAIDKGWISIHRKLKDHWIYPNNRKFTEFEAWIDILLEVNHKDASVQLGLTVIECKRGQSIKSLDTWANKWKWNKSYVRRFFNLLQKYEMIKTENVKKTTRITVCKYDTYQIGGNDDETILTQSCNDLDTQLTPNNNDNNDNNKYIVNFEEARKIYPGKKRGSDTEFKNYTKKHKDWKNVLPKLKTSIENQIQARERKVKSGQWVPEWKNFTTWINNRCWEEETGSNNSLEAIVGYKMIVDRTEAMLNGKEVYIGKMPVYKQTPGMVSIDDPRLTDLPIIKA